VILTHDGITQPVEEWALDYGITPELIEHRMSRGWNTAAAIETPMDAPKGYRLPEVGAPAAIRPPTKRAYRAPLTLDGRTLSLTDWALRSGISYHTLRDRLRRGMSIAEAPSKPIVTGGDRRSNGGGGGKQLSAAAKETGAPVTRKIAPK